MPRAEAGSTKSVANKLKAAGLGRLRWYCQACEKQMRDENGFKCHAASEAHVRKLQLIGEDPRRAINEYSAQFQRDFVSLLRTAHGEKKVHMNHFYQEYINDKHHVHMNATRWNSLTEFGKHLGREGVCRVYDEGEKGLHISWVDNSPEALRRQEAVRKKERQDKGDEEREQRAILEQVERAKRAKAEDGAASDEGAAAKTELVREEGKKISLSFGAKKSSTTEPVPSTQAPASEESADAEADLNGPRGSEEDKATKDTPGIQLAVKPPKPTGFAMKPAAGSKPKNVFATGKRKEAPSTAATKTPISNAQRIMMEEQAKRRKVF